MDLDYQISAFLIKMSNSKKLFEAKEITGGSHGSHSVYWVPVKLFNSFPISRWKYNRPCDEDRVKEIHESIKSKGRMDGQIYLACINDELVCYESNHRREALNGLDNIATILVDILWNATHDAVKEEFFRLNKAVSVPELYLEDEKDVNPYEGLKEAVDLFCENYKKLKSASNHPQRPNFNRDMVIDEFYRVMKENSINIDQLSSRLMKLNQEMSKRDKSKLTERVIKKCEESNLWLFAWSSKLNEKELA
jgi:hypothetical protein